MKNVFSMPIERILAIDPSRRGFGFAILDGPVLLADWGLRRAKGKVKCLERAAALIRRYQPDVLVVEQTSAPGCRRRERALRVIKSLLTLARGHRLRVRRISRRSVQRCFGARSPATKHQIAVALAVRFPELAPHLPPARKNNGDSEDERMAIFDAVAFAWRFYEPFRRVNRALASLSAEMPFPNVQAE